MTSKLKLFGTDGVRGKVGEHPMTVDFTSRIAGATASVLAPQGGTVVVGKDTRISGYMFESALEAAFVASGLDVMLLGPLPTPAISFTIKDCNANFGIVISASHNSYEYNGIKILNNLGEKLDMSLEVDIENQLSKDPITQTADTIGRATRNPNARDKYTQFVSGIFNQPRPLKNMKVVVDCSHGAAYKVAPIVLSSLGADVIPIGCSPNGYNINLNCGSTNVDTIAKTVPALSADLGIALDGDADRVILIDPNGNTIEGDQILYILAKNAINVNKFSSKIVGTILTNSGLEISLNNKGIKLYRSEVGDKNVLQLMRQTGSIIGGENSGHIINLEYSPSGDGLMTSLLIMKTMIESEKSLDELLDGLDLIPQLSHNIETDVTKISNDFIAKISDDANTNLKNGRVLVRKSGTEPMLRITVESQDKLEAQKIFESIKTQINQA
jgi:phosphoglucosamine mutase